jgi:hypothetical protein
MSDSSPDFNSSFRYVGKKRRTKEDPRFVTGRGRYVADVQLPDMKHVAIVASPYPSARITAIRTDAALASPGVVYVLAGAEFAQHTDPLYVGVDAPKVLRYALATDGQFNVLNGTLCHPNEVGGGIVRRRQGSGVGLKLHVHLTNEVAVAGDRHGDTTTAGRRAVHSLLDVLHGEVRVALVNRLEESHLRVAGQEHVLGAVSHELHKTTSHCLLYYRPIFFFGGTRAISPESFPMSITNGTQESIPGTSGRGHT